MQWDLLAIFNIGAASPVPLAMMEAMLGPVPSHVSQPASAPICRCPSRRTADSGGTLPGTWYLIPGWLHSQPQGGQETLIFGQQQLPHGLCHGLDLILPWAATDPMCKSATAPSVAGTK